MARTISKDTLEQNLWKFTINSYRVLLTRGRDGFIVFIPEEEELDAVAEVFSEIGIEEL